MKWHALMSGEQEHPSVSTFDCEQSMKMLPELMLVLLVNTHAKKKKTEQATTTCHRSGKYAPINT